MTLALQEDAVEDKPREDRVKALPGGLFQHGLQRPDGRALYLYKADAAPFPVLPQGETEVQLNPHLRYHALRGEWVMVAAARAERTFKPPAEYCPLCPTKPHGLETEIPYSSFDIAVFENRFPSLAKTAKTPTFTGPSEVAPGVGVCEVVVYDPDHNASTSTLSEDKWRALVRVWRDRTLELGSRAENAYVMIFENRGEDVGVTLHHPHGQVYAYPFVPPTLERERAQIAAQGDILGKLLTYDLADGARVVLERDYWLALVPFWARYPFEVYIIPKALRNSLLTLSEAEQDELAAMLSSLTKAYDALFETTMPYVMAIQQAPRAEMWPDYRMRVEFQPRLRAKNKLKYLAGTEVAAGAFAVDALAEDYAQRLREVLA